VLRTEDREKRQIGLESDGNRRALPCRKTTSHVEEGRAPGRFFSQSSVLGTQSFYVDPKLELSSPAALTPET
jgi:hypothetical protein